MFANKGRDPEDPATLARLVPERRYIRQEVDTMREFARGLVNDGLPVVWVSPVVEFPLWYRVELAYDDGTPERAYETWYFFKQYPDVQ